MFPWRTQFSNDDNVDKDDNDDSAGYDDDVWYPCK